MIYSERNLNENVKRKQFSEKVQQAINPGIDRCRITLTILCLISVYKRKENSLLTITTRELNNLVSKIFVMDKIYDARKIKLQLIISERVIEKYIREQLSIAVLRNSGISFQKNPC